MANKNLAQECESIHFDSKEGEETFFHQLKQKGTASFKVIPFMGKKQIHIQLPMRSFSGLAFRPDDKLPAFTVPYWIKKWEQIQERTQFILIKCNSEHFVFLALRYEKVLASFSSSSSNQLQMDLSCQDDCKEPLPILVAAQGKDLFTTLSSAFKLFLKETGDLGKLRSEKNPLPPWLSYLGFETSVCFGNDISHDKILTAIQSLKKAGQVWPRFVLIDEGWQEVEDDKLVSFHADSNRFPKGLLGLVEDLRCEGIGHVGVWHGIMGSKGGISKKMASKYGLENNKKGEHYLGENLGRTFEFFNDYYHDLRAQGIDFIKVGDQGAPFLFADREERIPQLYKNLHSAMQAAANLHFDYTYFNAECLRAENLSYWPNSLIARTAKDCHLETEPDIKRWMSENLANSLWLQTLMLPDFNAWKTKGVCSEMLAMFHALSGSINVISDPPGAHDSSKLKKIALPTGELLKADAPLLLCPEVVFVNPESEKKIYKAFTFKGEAGIIVAFHLSPSISIQGEISSSDLPYIKGEKFAVFSHRKGFLGVVQPNEPIKLSLKHQDCDLFTFAPVIDGTAVIGCYAYYLAPGPITEINREEGMLHINSQIGAHLLMYCERPVLEIRRNGDIIPWEYDEQSGVLSIGSRDSETPVNSQYTIYFEN